MSAPLKKTPARSDFGNVERHFDPTMPETFVDSLRFLAVKQDVVRLELEAHRIKDEENTVAYIAARLVLTKQAAVDLHAALDKKVKDWRAEGIIMRSDAPPIDLEGAGEKDRVN